jgi:hypothetical protein
MADFFRFAWRCIKHAWRGCWTQANEFAGVLGGAILFLILFLLRNWLRTMNLIDAPTTLWGTAGFAAGLAIASVIAAFLVIFSARLVLAPTRLYWEQHQRAESLELELAAAKTAKKDVSNISARDAYFRVLDDSDWKDDQLINTIERKELRWDWLEFRLKKEIHEALRNSRLEAWGEQCLHGMVTTPEKPIPPDEWDKIELDFNRNPHLPRTAACFKGPTTFEKGPTAWLGVKFFKEQFFQLFPLGLQGEWRPMFKAVQHVSWRLDDRNAAEHWPGARLAIRQAALDKKITIRGHKSAEPMKGSRWNAVETDIPSDYWETADIMPLATTPEGDELLTHTLPHKFSDGWYGETIYLYARLHIKWSEIVEVWPSC